MEITFLGITGNQTKSTETVSFLVKSDFSILCETGPAVMKQLLLAGKQATSIDAVFVSHCHGDHSLGFPYFMFSNFTERMSGQKGPESIKVYSLPEVHMALQKMLEASYPPGSFHNFAIDWCEIDEQLKISLGDTSLSFVNVDHRVPTSAIRIDYNGKSIVYSSDTIFSDKVVNLAQNCDLLIHEAALTSELSGMASNTKHSTAGDAGKVAQLCNAKKLMLVHMFDQYVGKYERIVNEAKQEYRGEILIPEQLVTYNI